jgi:hypothetical protein
VRVVLDGVEVRIAHRARQPCETTVEQIGGCFVLIGTGFPQHGVVLNSCYLADPTAATLAASHLLTVPGRPPAMWQRTAGVQRTGARLERICLLDHAAVLLDSLDELWADAVAVTISDTALDEAREIWMRTRP